MAKTKTSATLIEYLVRGRCSEKQPANITKAMPSWTCTSAADDIVASCASAQAAASAPAVANANHSRVAAGL